MAWTFASKLVKPSVHRCCFYPQAPIGWAFASSDRGTVVPMRVKDAVGRYGEDLAADFLTEAGLRILARNWRCSDGELDIVALDGPVLVFVEVKTRSTAAFGDPAEAMTGAKVARIHRLAVRWLQDNRGPQALAWAQLRFDVVSIVRLAPGGPAVRHIRDAF